MVQWAMAHQSLVMFVLECALIHGKKKMKGLFPQDINGDGKILQMRFQDPNGDWKVSPSTHA